MDSEAALASFMPLVEEAVAAGARTWDVEADEGPDQAWISARPRDERTPEQGWKLHVSATSESAGEVLRRALPALVAGVAAFKLANSPATVEFLNEGLAGLSQVGKFITVYPRDDDHAVQLAAALDEATRGLEGPHVPSDRPLRGDSLVHYRYGGFVERIAYTATGRAMPTILADDRWVPDPRDRPYGGPDWTGDPFEDAGLAEPVASSAIAGRYAVVASLHRSARGATHLAIDLESMRSVVLKQAARHARARPGLGDARDQLRWEAELLERLAGDPRFPDALDVVEHDGDVFLALERFEGEPLGRRVTRMAASGRLTPRPQIVAWGRELAAALADLHELGLAYRDLSPLNVIVGLDGRLRLVDFEVAAPLGGETAGEAVGTVGYASPQQYAGEAPSVLDDVHGLGALLFLLATGTDPLFAEEREEVLPRPVNLMSPETGEDLAAVIERCLDARPERRYPDMASVAAALSDLPEAAQHPPRWGETPSEGLRAHHAELAAELGGQVADWILEGEGADGSQLEGLEARMELNGAVLVLLALGPAGVASGVDAVASGARRLADLEPTDGAGFHLGEGGIAVSLARAGRLFEDASLSEAAAARAGHLAALTPRGVDLYGGAAGALRAHLLLWQETGDAGALEAARVRGDALLEAAEEAGDDTRRWRSPPDPGEDEGALFCGYAHGTAGIADVLLDLAEATDEARYRDAALSAARWVDGMAAPALGDGSGVTWPERDGGEPTPPLWCIGAAGIARLYLHLAASGVDPSALEKAKRAAHTASRGGRFLGPTWCHGLAGSVELLCDVHAATGEERWLEEALALARLLEAHRDADGEWRSDSGEPLGFDLLTGRGGVALAFARLATA